MNRLFPALILFICGCASTQPSVSGDSPSMLHYTAGDFVVYQYSGENLKATASLRQTITEVKDNHVHIDLIASKEGSQKRWSQVMSVNPTNPGDTTVEELFEWVGPQKQRLENDSNEDLQRLYAWTLPGDVFRPSSSPRIYASVGTIGTTHIQTRCVEVDGEMGRVPVSMLTCDSKEFLWYHVESTLTRQEDGKVLWQTRVEDFGPQRPKD